MPAPEYGMQDDKCSAIISYINSIIADRSSENFESAEKKLLNKLGSLKQDEYAAPRICNELAEIYSYQLLDLEQAIKYDKKLLSYTISDNDTNNKFIPANFVANQQIISDNSYVEHYIKISKRDLQKAAKTRLARNQSLLKGEIPNDKRYKQKRLLQHLKKIKNDLHHGVLSSRKKRILISRLIRAEYEIHRFNHSFTLSSYKYFLNKKISIRTVDLSEIDFLSLADYFSSVYQQTKVIRFAKYALESIYLPYTNIRDRAHRWAYNRLINRYISTLIRANHKEKNYESMLFYTSLNKSRMLLEEELDLSTHVNSKKNIQSINTSIKLDQSGIPSFQWFNDKLSSLGASLDLYLDTSRTPGKNARKIRQQSLKNSALYITFIDHGKAGRCIKISGQQLAALKQELDKSLQNISSDNAEYFPSPTLAKAGAKLHLPNRVLISPDKWLTRHPLGYHLGVQETRTVNLFLAPVEFMKQFSEIKLAGFFNPTQDLDGSEKEAETIRNLLPESKIFLRNQATVTRLQKEYVANLVHLSMHGRSVPEKPMYSKLYFAGAKLDGDHFEYKDPKALYAKDIMRYPLLKQRDLIFTAACETGLTFSQAANSEELMGILRPLTVAGNKNIILSLWDVDDAATLDFVVAFYNNLIKNHNITKAFLDAQQQIQHTYHHPYFWAPFYLSQRM